MVFGIFSRKIDRAKVYQDVRRVEQHFQNTILGAEPPLENIMEEFDRVLAEIIPAHESAMLEPLLRLEELSAGIASSFYAMRISVRLRGNLRRRWNSEEIGLYERLCRKHCEFLEELETAFYPQVIRHKKLAAVVANRRFHWLCELTKIFCLQGKSAPPEYFEAAESIMAFGEAQEITEIRVSPYRNLYPEERVSLNKNRIRQYLITVFLNSDLPGSDLDVANTLWRMISFRHAQFSEKRTPESTHFIPADDADGTLLLRVYPELNEKKARLWFSGLRLASEMRKMAPRVQELQQGTALGGLFSQVISEKSVERTAILLSASQIRENQRMPVCVDTEAFAEIIDCICYLRRVNEDFLIGLSDVDEKRKFNIHEQFEEMKFGYVEGHVNQATRRVVTESLAKGLTRKLDAEYANCGMAPALWRIDDVSANGYGLTLPVGVKPAEVGSLVILSRTDGDGIEFAVVKRFTPGPEKNVLGVEFLYPGCEVDPFFILRCRAESGDVLSPIADPYGFLLTPEANGEATGCSVVLLPKRTRLPQCCTVQIKTMDDRMEGELAGVCEEGLNWVVYRWNPSRF